MKIKVTTTASDAPSPFVTQHRADVIGVLCGFDRLRLMATLRPLYQPSLMMRYLSRAGVLLKGFAAFASGWIERVRAAAHQLAEQSGRPLIYLRRSSERKELLARDLARRDGLSQGFIGIWSVLEPCLTYFVRRDREQKKLVLRLGPGKCLHYYFYFLHEQLGLLHLRLQRGFPLPFTSASTVATGWPAKWIRPASATSSAKTVLPELKTRPRPRHWRARNSKARGRPCCNRSLSNAIRTPRNCVARWRCPTIGA
jgi:hypothetical protein